MRRQGPQQPPSPTADRPLGRQPKSTRQPLKYIHGTMETASFHFLRSGAGGYWSIPALAHLLQEVDEAPGHTASCLPWRTSGTLQQIFNLTTLAPAHPLTAVPYYDNWISADEGFLPLGLPGSSLLDLTNSTVAARANCPEFIQRLPPMGTVVVTLGRPGRHVAAALASMNYAIIAKPDFLAGEQSEPCFPALVCMNFT